MNTADLPHSETAASRVEPRKLVALAGDTAAQVRRHLCEDGRADWELLCVIDDEGRLLGSFSAAELLILPDAAVLGDRVCRDQPRVRSDTDQEEMASMALQQGVTALPVVDAAGQLIGVVGSVAMMEVLRREHVEDLHRLAGVTCESDDARNALDEQLRSARHRLPRLIVGLDGSMVATFIVVRFETELATRQPWRFLWPVWCTSPMPSAGRVMR